MVRIGLILCLMLVMAAGPWFCCCSFSLLARWLLTPARPKQTALAADNHACCRHQLSEHRPSRCPDHRGHNAHGRPCWSLIPRQPPTIAPVRFLHPGLRVDRPPPNRKKRRRNRSQVEGNKGIGLEQKTETADPAPCRRPHGSLTPRDFPRRFLSG